MKFLVGVCGAVMTLLAAAISWADVAAGQQAFQANGCTGCHYTQGPAREKTIEDQLAKKGPELWYAGSKFQRPWLEAWLKDPQPIRLMQYNSLTEKNPGGHAKLTEADATAVADFLMSLTSDVVVSGVITPKRHPKGRLIFVKKMPCNGCHQYVERRKILGGVSGPSLVDASVRLNPDWIFAYLKSPTAFKPVKMMPVFAGLMSEKDMESVAAFIATFERP